MLSLQILGQNITPHLFEMRCPDRTIDPLAAVKHYRPVRGQILSRRQDCASQQAVSSASG